MKSLNRVTFMGHLVADPEIKSTKSGKSVSTFALATNNEWFDSDGVLQKSVDYHRIVAWESLADLCKKFLRKGSPVYLEGRLTNRAYEGKDKLRHYITEVVLNQLQILQWEASKKAVQAQELAVA